MGRKKIYTDEQLLERKRARNKLWRENNPEQARISDKRLHDRQYREDPESIKERNSDWQKANRERRNAYNRERRAQKKAEQ